MTIHTPIDTKLRVLTLLLVEFRDERRYQPLMEKTMDMIAPVTMNQLLEAGVHFGHRTQSWNPKMKPFIYGARGKIHIINLGYTLPMLQKSLEFAAKIAARNGKILFVGTKTQARGIVRAQAERCDMPFVDYRWLGGQLTNFKTIMQRIKYLKELNAMRDSGLMDKMIKKEALMLERTRMKLEQGLGGIMHMNSLPEALFVVDTCHEHIAVREANHLQIPVIGIVDTNANPDNINYPIAGNDDSCRAIELYCAAMADTIIAAKEKANQMTVKYEDVSASDIEKNLAKE